MKSQGRNISTSLMDNLVLSQGMKGCNYAIGYE